MKLRITRSATAFGVALVAVTSAAMATQPAAMADTLPSQSQQEPPHAKPSPPPMTNGPTVVTVGGETKEAKSATESAAATFWCRARAEDPRALSSTSNTIYAEGVITTCGGSPTACHLGVDLEKYNGYTHTWYTMAHSPGKWKSCRGYLDAGYHCTHDSTTKWGYRTHIWLLVEKGTAISPLGQAYSANTKLFWCA